MGRLAWDDALSINIAKIDDQHKELIKLINRLEDATEDSSWSKKIVTLTDVLLEMTEYLEYHFSTEEQHMIDYSYPDYDAHRKEHQNFIQKVSAFCEDFKSGRKGLTNDILIFLKNWYLNHILTIDAEMGSYFNQKGLT